MEMATADVERRIAVRIEPRGAVIAAVPGATLLDVLLHELIPISHSCQAGRCGTCRCELLAGDVIEDSGCEFRGSTVPGATRQVLACRTRLVGDCVIGLIEPDEIVRHAAQTLRCRVEAVDRLNESTILLRLRPNRPLAFSAGQFARLDFGAGLVRPYSMANPEGSEVLEFHIRLVAGGRVTSFVANRLRCGDSVKLMGPLGVSYLRRNHSGPILCVAGGTGLAPIGSIVRTAVSCGVPGPIHVYVGGRAESELYGVAELRKLESQYALHVSVAVDVRPSCASVRHGLVTDVVAADHASLARWKVYLAGPPAMVEAGTRLALKLGVQPGDIHADAFYSSER